MDVVELASSLIAYKTEIPPGDEEECAKFLHDYIVDSRLGAEAEVDSFGRGRANLTLRIGPPEPGLLLSGHIDVVPAGDPGAWSYDPFRAREKEGRLYGRGAADMKGGLAAALKAIETIRGRRLRRGLIFVATAGEEVGFEGLKRLIKTGQLKRGLAKFGVLAEPTDLRPVRAHKGLATFRITFHGKGGHASDPGLGINAIESCAKFVRELATWNARMKRASDPDLGSTLATPTVVRGGTKSNVIPGSCELIVDTRWVPRHSTAFVEEQMADIADSLAAKDKKFSASVEMLYDAPSLATPAVHPVVRLAESLSGAASEVAPYGTEAALYSTKGIPSVVLGPGSVNQAHTVDEYVEVKQLRRAESIYAKMISSVCA